MRDQTDLNATARGRLSGLAVPLLPLELVQVIFSRPRSSEALPDRVIRLLTVAKISALVGDVMVTIGATMSGIVYITLRLAEPLLPASSSAVTAMVLRPWLRLTSGMDQFVVPWATPLVFPIDQVTWLILRSSWAVPAN